MLFESVRYFFGRTGSPMPVPDCDVLLLPLVVVVVAEVVVVPAVVGATVRGGS